MKSAQIDFAIICHHHPHSENAAIRKSCSFRKPKSTGLVRILRNLRIDSHKSVLAGDRITDIIAGVDAQIGNCYLVAGESSFESNVIDNFSLGGSFNFFTVARIHDISYSHSCHSNLDFNILILSAGRGKRLSPITNKMPKPLLRLSLDESILSRLISQLNFVLGDQLIHVNISYLAPHFLIDRTILDKHKQILFSWEPTMLGSLLTLQRLFEKSKKGFLVFHGDLVLESEDIERFTNLVKSDMRMSYLACHSRTSERARSQVAVKDSMVTSFREGSLDSVTGEETVFVNSGIYFFSEDDLNLFFSCYTHFQTGSDITGHLLPFLVRNKRLNFFDWSGQRISIDSLLALDEAQKLVSMLKSN
jgi:CTP:phosphocholine cytidylyltransferase-like protein